MRTETKVQHTPGPWRHYRQGDGTAVIVATVTRDEHGRSADVVRVPLSDQCGEANARLIAAAPELLEAAKGVETLYAELSAALPVIAGTEAFERVVVAVAVARAAIAKATGEQ